MEHRLGSMSQELNSWISGPLWEHQPPEAPSFLSKQKPNPPLPPSTACCLPWQREGWGVKTFLLPGEALTLNPSSPSCFEDLACGGYAPPPQQPHPPLQQCSYADISCFCLISFAFTSLGVPRDWDASMTPLFSTLVVGFSSQELYHLSIISTDLGIERWVHSVCSALLILSLVTNLKLLTDCWPWNGHLT